MGRRIVATNLSTRSSRLRLVVQQRSRGGLRMWRCVAVPEGVVGRPRGDGAARAQGAARRAAQRRLLCRRRGLEPGRRQRRLRRRGAPLPLCVCEVHISWDASAGTEPKVAGHVRWRGSFVAPPCSVPTRPRCAAEVAAAAAAPAWGRSAARRQRSGGGGVRRRCWLEDEELVCSGYCSRAGLCHTAPAGCRCQWTRRRRRGAAPTPSRTQVSLFCFLSFPVPLSHMRTAHVPPLASCLLGV